MVRSRFTLDLSAVRRNAEALRRAAGGAELWAVVKADGYGHGAVDVARAALEGGATALCVATPAEALELRSPFPDARVIVMGPVSSDEIATARDARLELVAGAGEVPVGVPVHLKLDTGMGRWGISELPSPTRDVVGVMSHLASSENDPAFTELQIERFREATQGLDGVARHLANSAGTLRYPEAAFDAVRCGIALYGISPFGTNPARRRTRAGASLGVARRPRQAPRAGREHGLRAAVRRRPPDVDRDRPGRLRGWVPARPHRD